MTVFMIKVHSIWRQPIYTVDVYSASKWSRKFVVCHATEQSVTVPATPHATTKKVLVKHGQVLILLDQVRDMLAMFASFYQFANNVWWGCSHLCQCLIIMYPSCKEKFRSCSTEEREREMSHVTISRSKFYIIHNFSISRWTLKIRTTIDLLEKNTPIPYIYWGRSALIRMFLETRYKSAST